MKTKTVEELKAMMDEGADFQLIDVREPYEYEICNIKGELMPMNSIPNNIDKIARDKPVIMQCRSGSRSGRIIQFLEQNYGFDNLYNLSGGILAWADEIDPEMQKY
jgi:rhodanese-related sulfurtransferase